MIKVALLGHSNLRSVPDPDGFWHYREFQIETFCCSGATIGNVTTYPEYKKLVTKNFDVVIVFLGGNDLRNGCNIANLYDSLKTLLEDLNNTIIPKFGTYLLEPEARLGKPEFISEKGYYRLRNSLLRKVKNKKELRALTLVGKDLNLSHIGKDGVHFNKRGVKKFREIIEDHLSEIIKKAKKVQNIKDKPRPIAEHQSTSKEKKSEKSKKSLKYKIDIKKNKKQREESQEKVYSRKGKESNSRKVSLSTKKQTKLKKD